MTEMTNPDTLPQWKGHPVPWVTRWTNQISRKQIQVRRSPEGNVYVVYDDGIELREYSGVLWMREGLGRGGTPEFAEVSALRQRASMLKRLCQVCGQRIPPGMIRWLMSAKQMKIKEGEALTFSPPTCEGCIPLALKLCPHLKIGDNAAIYRVLDYNVWGVYGSAITWGEDEDRAKEWKGLYVQYGRNYTSFNLDAVVARQQVVRFNKFVQEN